MTNEITLVSIPNVDWQSFVTNINSRIGRSPTRELDSMNIPVGNMASFVSAIAELVDKGHHPIHALSDMPYLLRHLSFTFFVSTDDETFHQFLVANDNFTINPTDSGRNKVNFIVTGNLLQWRDFIIGASTKRVHAEIRTLANDLWNIFNKLGLREIFSQYIRKNTDNHTFILESRR